MELLIDRVIVTDEEVEIRHVIPTVPSSEHVRFCHLRSDYLHHPSVPPQPLARVSPTAGDPRHYAPLLQGLAASREIVALVGMQLLGTLARSATRLADWRDGNHNFLQDL